MSQVCQALEIFRIHIKLSFIFLSIQMGEQARSFQIRLELGLKGVPHMCNPLFTWLGVVKLALAMDQGREQAHKLES